jgi:1-acyl-sn-glycerol-3-phosphate acyltransferase
MTTFTVVNNNSFLSSLGGGGVFLGGERGRLLMRSRRSRGKHYSTTMDNEKKMKMKKTKTTTMMENNTNEHAQRKERSRGTTTRRKRNSSVTCKATTNAFQNNHVFSAAAAATGGGATKLWSGNPNDVSLLAILRCIAFTLWTFSLAVPLFLTMCVIFPFCYFLDRTRRYALSFVNDVWAICSTSPFVKITVEGREHLPKQDEPAVYVANHASFMDIFSLFHLKRPFKFISKTSNFIIPIIGWSMFLTGHVPLKRTDRRSQMETLKICRETLQKNGSVLFFPEGTRSKDGTMAEFKKGAFSVAAKEKVPIVPITIVNAGGIMRNGKEWMLRKGEIKVIVHPRIEASENADELCQKSENVIKEALVNNS